MTSVGRFIPIYDAWSNEGGGRAIEEGIRYSERKAIKRMEAELSEWNRRDVDRQRSWAALEARQTVERDTFGAKYGAEALADKDSFWKANSVGGGVELSPLAKAMLADLAKIESSRVMVENGAGTRRVLEDRRGRLESSLAEYRASIDARQNAYDARFEKDDGKRADAYERAQAAAERMEQLAALSQARQTDAARRAAELAARASTPDSMLAATWNEQSTRRAGEVAAALFASTKLFEFGRDGSVKIDAVALSNMGTTEAATAELARLIGTLAERNGLGQLRDALIGAINGQNRRIADRAGVSA